jgi:hypothetical protein
MPSLTHDLTTIGLQVLVIVTGAALVAGLVRRRRPAASALGLAGAMIAGAFMVGIVAGQVSGSASLLSRERHRAVSAETGRDECFHEPGGAKAANLSTTRLPFAVWARHQMGLGATYSLAGFRSPPDDLCLYFVLLPALPAMPGERATWTIAYGAVPKPMRARIAARDPAVLVYAPGFALQRNEAR